MGLGGISPVQLIIILVIVLLIFGTKKLKNLGGDLGGAIKGFKKAVKEEGAEEDNPDQIEGSDEEAVASAQESAEATEDKKQS